MHGLEIKADVYIDDLRVVDSTREGCTQKIAQVRAVLSAAGFVEARTKAINPTQRGTFLGLVNDTRLLLYFIPPSKLDAILLNINGLMTKRQASIREVASLYGSLAACALAVGPVLRLLTRTGRRAFSSAADQFGWSGWMDVTELRDELLYLHRNLHELNGFPFDGKELCQTVNIMIASDASQIGFGVTQVCCGDERTHNKHAGVCEKVLLLKQRFNVEEIAASSTHREMLAIKAVYTQSLPRHEYPTSRPLASVD